LYAVSNRMEQLRPLLPRALEALSDIRPGELRKEGKCLNGARAALSISDPNHS
jgi:hypothetical protein